MLLDPGHQIFLLCRGFVMAPLTQEGDLAVLQKRVVIASLLLLGSWFDAFDGMMPRLAAVCKSDHDSILCGCGITDGEISCELAANA